MWRLDGHVAIRRGVLGRLVVSPLRLVVSPLPEGPLRAPCRRPGSLGAEGVASVGCFLIMIVVSTCVWIVYQML